MEAGNYGNFCPLGAAGEALESVKAMLHMGIRTLRIIAPIRKNT